MAEIPGVDLISKGPGIGTPVIRGLSMSNILFLNKCVPLQNYQFSANHPYLVDEYGVDRIEVIKGPASLIYGSGAVGGVINLIEEPVSPEGKIMGDAKLKYFRNIFIKAGIDLAFAQNKHSEFETASPAYKLIGLGIGLDIRLKHQLINLSLTAINLLNITYIDHLSTLKELGIYDIGRNITFAIKVPFMME